MDFSNAPLPPESQIANVIGFPPELDSPPGSTSNSSVTVTPVRTAAHTNGATSIDNETKAAGAGTKHPRRALSMAQERKLLAYLDEKFLQMMRGYKKRSETSSELRTLSAYLSFARHLLALILQIPPIDPSTSLRTAYLLRLTGDVLGSVVGYPLYIPTEIESGGQSPDPKQQLHELLDFLDDLDQAWLAVLQSQVWDPNEGTGVDLVIDSNTMNAGLRSSPPSQTEVARLRSLLVGGEAALEEWLVEEKAAASGKTMKGGFGLNDDEGDFGGDVSGMLEQMGLLDEFDELFSRTLDQIGNLGGYVVEPVDNMDTS
ncbi:hypothetical protein BDQ12DRAFT_706667 [Crucibulum laeve]|uniref:Uncharacterized protein n=1 Tax=Crucibulum laeve TaxID=68775 RepID=A0A5C3M350_9AGAR|nr:hypothetical protein BDQ12DRAFT_706667 [Crucibulum laeve]